MDLDLHSSIPTLTLNHVNTLHQDILNFKTQVSSLPSRLYIRFDSSISKEVGRFTLKQYGYTHFQDDLYFLIDHHTTIEQICSILYQDRKNNTYKIALLRALNAFSNSLEVKSLVRFDSQFPDKVYIPLGALMLKWIEYYWPLVAYNFPQTTSKQTLKVHEILCAFIDVYQTPSSSDRTLGYLTFLNDLHYQGLKSRFKSLERLSSLFRFLKKAIRQPIRYSGQSSNPPFQYSSHFFKDSCQNYTYQEIIYGFGAVELPVSFMIEMKSFGRLVEDPIILHWADAIQSFACQQQRSLDLHRILSILRREYFEVRNQRRLRIILESKAFLETTASYTLKSIFKNDQIKEKYEIDHLLPYSLFYNNHLWNLVPISPQLNRKKSNKLILDSCIDQNELFILWDALRSHHKTLFDSEVKSAFGFVIENSSDYLSLYHKVLESALYMHEVYNTPLWIQ